MDLNTNGAATATNSFATTRHHHRKPMPSQRFLPIPPPPSHHLHSTSDTELTEHDIFGISPDLSSTFSSSIHHRRPSSTRTLPHSRSDHGVLAALPGEGDSEIHSVFNHKASPASVSSPSTSSSNSILSSPSSTSSASRLTIPKRPPPPRRTLHMSAPVNVPVFSEAMRRSRAARGLDDVIDDTDEEEENAGEFFPPHEIIAAKQTPTLSCSVMEGVGRTLKGRDLRQVRNAVWRTTGFLD